MTQAIRAVYAMGFLSNYRLRRQFGITLQQYYEMAEAQNHKCAVCGLTKKENMKVLAVDHCHSTGKVRALPCCNCNCALGFLKENAQTARKMADYIEAHCRQGDKNMSYMKLRNLYQNPEVIHIFREVYCLEKIHGTSAHALWKDGRLSFFSGGAKHANFVKVFDQDKLQAKLLEEFGEYTDVLIHGEAYGGKMQRMSHAYGKELKFIAFDVKIDGHWLSVPNAHDVATKLGLEFVDYLLGPATLEFVNEQRDRPSVQAVRNGIEEPQIREGVVIRPLIELTKNNDERIMAKHKGEKFCETKTPREVDPEKLKVLEDAREIAEEWVTANRLVHVMDKLSPDGIELTIKDTKRVIGAMIQDVRAESEGEIIWSGEVSKSIGRVAAAFFKRAINKLRE